MTQMKNKKENRYGLQFFLWFTFLSTLGVGGGIYFLLVLLVPIEQLYVNQGWSQFRIDSIMKYYVIGWVVFGFIASFVYYFLVVKKKKWKLAWAFAIAAVLLCGSALYSFLNTGTGLIQASQGTIVEGDRFTFGPYPEKEDMEQLKAEGYDGVISLLSPILPIEKPLLDKETKSGEEVGIEVLSLPMLPWVGDNSASIEEIRKLIQEDGKRYYVHCYLGRHRVDVVKQVINEELGDQYELRILQPTTLERGNMYYFPNSEVLMGPYPTDEEWFTRINRAEVREVISLLQPANHSERISEEIKLTSEMDIIYTSMPMSDSPTIEEMKNVTEYAKGLDHKVYIHNFQNPAEINRLYTYMALGKVLLKPNDFKLSSGKVRTIGERLLIGFEPSSKDRELLTSIGVEEVILPSDTSIKGHYDLIGKVKESKKLVYLVANTIEEADQLERIAIGMLFGSFTRGIEFDDKKFAKGSLLKHERNLVIGPLLTEAEFKSFGQASGIAQILYLYSASMTTETELEEIKELASDHGIPLKVIPMYENYEDTFIPLLDYENGLNYIMVEAEFQQLVNDYIKKF
ncbi:hypothetical protein ACFSFY_12040 [Sporosarcina siberiensis]|uniref:Uncharacterized protein n=1 Tax=Sporosarcina siberiensis TaxID=1365606 RepID=A0ABW4SHL1_9BACL